MSKWCSRRNRRRFLVSTVAVLFLATWGLFAAMIPPPAKAAPTWDFEVGQDLTLGGPYVQARVNLELGEVGLLGLKFWLLPEAGVTLTDPATSYGRVQILADHRLVTLGAEVRTGNVARMFLRFGL
ncbi:MAG TPA: hypothetical protein GXX28_05605 [Firmicutes bacterium]|nr:hypothetical protein [Bacillota bacterium]